MTFGVLQTETLRRLEEPAGPVFWTTEEIADALRQAEAELADETEWHETWQTVDLLERRPYYDARAIFGDGVLRIGAAMEQTSHRWLTPATVQDLDARDRRWEARLGIPTLSLQRGLFWVGYWPRASSDTGTIKQYLTSLPTPLMEDTDEPAFPEAFHYALVEGALADLWAQDGEATRAIGAWQAYLTYEAGVRAWVQDRAGVPKVRGYV